MTADEMAAQCIKSINLATELGLDKASVVLVMPRKWKSPPKFPRRKLLCVNSRNEHVYSIDAYNLLAWLIGNNLVSFSVDLRVRGKFDVGCP